MTDYILKENTVINGDLVVEGDIKCVGGYWNLTVEGNINAVNINTWNIKAENIYALDIYAVDIKAGDIKAVNIYAADIDAVNIDAWSIDAVDIKAWNIDAVNINARDINADFVVCEKRIKKTKNAKTVCYSLIQNRRKLKQKEQMKEARS